MPTPEEQAAADTAAAAQAATDEAAAAAQHLAEKGYPKATPTTEMTEGQQAAYWREIARKHESVANTYRSLGTPEEIKAAKDAITAAEQAKLSETDRAVAAAREEGRLAAFTEANTSAAGAILLASLMSRGIEEAEATEILDGINTSAFVADDKVDTGKVHAYVNRITATVDPTNGTTRRGLDMGQGRRDRIPLDPRAAGKAEAAKRFPVKQQ